VQYSYTEEWRKVWVPRKVQGLRHSVTLGGPLQLQGFCSIVERKFGQFQATSAEFSVVWTIFEKFRRDRAPHPTLWCAIGHSLVSFYNQPPVKKCF